MASAPGYQRQVGPGGETELRGVSAFEMGAGVGAAIEHAGQELDHVAFRAHAIETQEARRTQLLGSHASLATAGAENDSYVRDLPKTAAPDKIVEYGLADWDERTRDLVPTDPKAAEQFAPVLAEQRAQLSDRLHAMQAGTMAGHQTTNAAAASNGMVNRAILNPDADTVGASLDQADHLAASLDQLDPDKREQFRQQLHGQIYAGVVGALNNANKPDEAAAWLSRQPVQAALKPEQMDALVTQTRVTQDRVKSQAKAAAGADFQTRSGALELQAHQLTVGRPSFDEAKGMAQSYTALAATAPTPNDRTAATLKAQEWQERTVEIGASEAYRGASPVERQARIAELAAKPTLSAVEGAELKGLQGQASYVNGLDTLGRYGYSTGRGVAPINFNDPASIAQRAATWSAAQAQYGGAPNFLMPGEEKPLKEIVKSGTVDQKVALFETVSRLPAPAARSTLDVITDGDQVLRATAAMGAFPNGDERIRLALQGIEAQKANREIWTRQKDATGKHEVGPTHEQLWASFAPALAGLPVSTQETLRTNTLNLYAGSAAKAGWNNFRPDELGRSLRFALGGGQRNGLTVGGIGSWSGRQVLLPNDMAQQEFENRMSRADEFSWGHASINGVAWAGNRAMTTGEARSLTPVAVDPSRGLYSLRSGNSFVNTKDGRPYLFDIHRLSDIPVQHLSAPVDRELIQLRQRIIR